MFDVCTKAIKIVPAKTTELDGCRAATLDGAGCSVQGQANGGAQQEGMIQANNCDLSSSLQTLLKIQWQVLSMPNQVARRSLSSLSCGTAGSTQFFKSAAAPAGFEGGLSRDAVRMHASCEGP